MRNSVEAEITFVLTLRKAKECLLETRADKGRSTRGIHKANPAHSLLSHLKCHIKGVWRETVPVYKCFQYVILF